ncbi:hypothetical protein PG985_000380 [Apiospora marii]|uniref:Uncharacterized protein n=1 Tax=Apiospora marii TaxID=335849 RepID=A0ABR1R1T6_9PEZI
MNNSPPSDDALVTNVLPMGALSESKSIADVMNIVAGDNYCLHSALDLVDTTHILGQSQS